VTQFSKGLIRDLLQGRLSSEAVQRMQRQDKDPGRRQMVLEIEQERLGWSEPILVCLQEHLFVVQRDDGSRVVRCDCGHEFGD